MLKLTCRAVSIPNFDCAEGAGQNGNILSAVYSFFKNVFLPQFAFYFRMVFGIRSVSGLVQGGASKRGVYCVVLRY